MPEQPARPPWTPRRAAVGPGVLVAFWAMLVGPFLVFGRVPVYRDLLQTYLPLRHFMVERLKAGHLPWWFPYEGLGEPFIGQGVGATFHPFTLAYLFLPLQTALRWEVGLGYLLGLLGAYWLCRALGLSVVAAWTAALALGLNGYALSLSNNPAYLRGLASMPWVGLCALQLAKGARPGLWAAALSVVWAQISLGGDASSTVLSGLVALVFFGMGGRPRRLGWLVAAGVGMGLLAGPELVPALDLRRTSLFALYRDSKLLSTFWALHWPWLTELLVPLSIPRQVGAALARAVNEPGVWADTLGAGLLTLVLAVLGAWRTPRARWVALLAVLGLWLAMGSTLGLERWLRSLFPFLNTVRYPEKHLSLFVLGISVSAGFGVDALLALGPRPALRRFLAVSAAALVAALGSGYAMWRYQLARPEYFSALLPTWRAAFEGRLALMLGILALGGAGAYFTGRFRGLALLFPVLMVVQLWDIPLGFGTAPESLLETPPLLKVARARGATPGGVRMLTAAPAPAPYHPDDVPAWAQWVREAGEPDVSALDGIIGLTGYSTLPLEPERTRRALAFDLTRARGVASLFSFSLLLEPTAPGSGGLRAPGQLLAEAEHLKLLEQNALPRVYLATPQWMDSDNQVLLALHHDPDLVRRHPVLVGPRPEGVPTPPAGETGARTDFAGQAQVLAYAPEEVVVQAHVERDGLLVLNDIAYPGWSAEVDGSAVPLLTANYLVRGVRLAQGEHRVVFRYVSPRGRAGLLAGALGLVWVAGLLLLGGFLGRSSEPGPALTSA